ncbi:hypothetical protein [Paracoccus shanxieyensis]|uniref:Uncharacterized protein n=1 Tax=Paracoccus shanxieyensis TaxID=2675752 RepID=A0A6L6J1T8_9RHOB|nr:hypothetical protein [Paracoccus shanxieyensis]MTH64647.1 hypothetical protein [Paracoccus shanxieyensis]MTH87791.1 hypothetical protein [Paracoccus shanxieyensis]
MSHNTDPERAAKRHPGPIIGLILAVLVAVAAFFWWVTSDPQEEGDIMQTESPAAAIPGATDPETTSPATNTPADPATDPPAPAQQ